ncbi:MAG: GNAT family N-acetyltransferase, partial [Natronosporangium sp.]
ATVRPAAPPDLDAATALWLELIRWDAQFGTGCVERPATARVFRQALRDALGRPEPWTWVAQVDGRVVGLLMIDPPERAGWVAPMIAAAPTGYLGGLVVTGRRRGTGAGAALVRAGHRALDAAGAGVTLLHYAGLNPLSAPFWHQCGYRPLWTTWRVSPAARLGLATL